MFNVFNDKGYATSDATLADLNIINPTTVVKYSGSFFEKNLAGVMVLIARA